MIASKLLDIYRSIYSQHAAYLFVDGLTAIRLHNQEGTPRSSPQPRSTTSGYISPELFIWRFNSCTFLSSPPFNSCTGGLSASVLVRAVRTRALGDRPDPLVTEPASAQVLVLLRREPKGSRGACQ